MVERRLVSGQSNCAFSQICSVFLSCDVLYVRSPYLQQQWQADLCREKLVSEGWQAPLWWHWRLIQLGTGGHLTVHTSVHGWTFVVNLALPQAVAHACGSAPGLVISLAGPEPSQGNSSQSNDGAHNIPSIRTVMVKDPTPSVGQQDEDSAIDSINARKGCTRRL